MSESCLKHATAKRERQACHVLTIQFHNVECDVSKWEVSFAYTLRIVALEHRHHTVERALGAIGQVHNLAVDDSAFGQSFQRVVDVGNLRNEVARTCAEVHAILKHFRDAAPAVKLWLSHVAGSGRDGSARLR